MSSVRRFIRGIVILIGLAFVVVIGLWLYFGSITLLDRPWFLSDKRETIEVVHVSWMCNCADFIETKNFNDDPLTGRQGKVDFIFVEPMMDALDLRSDPKFYNNRYKPIKLSGRFYYDKGIPSEYELGSIEDKPDHARVFLYDTMEYSN